MNQIMQNFATLDDGDRQTTMKALSTMMRDEKQVQSPKKKVNGFIGYRSYYSALFSQLQQKQRSPFMTTLWQQDTFHGEWDLMCGTYSTIRSLLAEEKITLQVWISYAVSPLGIVAREHYMAAMGWTLVQQEDGSFKLERTGEPMVERSTQLMSGLDLLMQCLKNGLPVSNPQPMIAALSNRSGDVMCVKTPGATSKQKSKPKPKPKNEDPLLAMAKENPALTMSRLFDIPVDHPWLAGGVQVFEIPSLNDLANFSPGTELQRGDNQLAHVQSQTTVNHDMNDISFDIHMGDPWVGQQQTQGLDHGHESFFDLTVAQQPVNTGYGDDISLQQLEEAIMRPVFSITDLEEQGSKGGRGIIAWRTEGQKGSIPVTFIPFLCFFEHRGWLVVGLRNESTAVPTLANASLGAELGSAADFRV
ncbi:mating-type protein MAT alpha 1-domain-containing protein [Echria macrotheca]|uniref:Mating-type protein MAT alpha 1-domain-containing protein n=1 Tax=Echria macrotheca TaxID=438768 RepID=A0AAJ0BJK2_9PEZI|nr:mating-type protein MAT alpha 1-domain-containing protein [Echria macrotheca]